MTYYYLCVWFDWILSGTYEFCSCKLIETRSETTKVPLTNSEPTKFPPNNFLLIQVVKTSMKETHSRVRKTQNQMPYLVFHKMGHIEQHAQHLNIFEFKHREYLLPPFNAYYHTSYRISSLIWNCIIRTCIVNRRSIARTSVQDIIDSFNRICLSIFQRVLMTLTSQSRRIPSNWITSQ